MDKQEPKLDIPLAPEVKAETAEAAAAAEAARRESIFLVSMFRGMDGDKIRTVLAYTPVEEMSSEIGAASPKVGFAGQATLRGEKGQTQPIEFPIPAETVQEAFAKFDETFKATLEELRSRVRRKLITSGAGLGIDALKKLRS